jgi:hypothetical protein
MARTRLTRAFMSIAAGTALLGAGALLAGCINNTPLDDLEIAAPTGTPFDTALYKNYAFLARSYGDVGEAQHEVFDYAGSISLNGTENGVAELANTYAAKAVDASKGTFIDPENSRTPNQHELRDRLTRALDPGRVAFPRDAARAQADYDCWVLNGTVESQKTAAEQCRKSLDETLALLESETQQLADEAKAAADSKKAAADADSAAPQKADTAAAKPKKPGKISPVKPTEDTNP